MADGTFHNLSSVFVIIPALNEESSLPLVLGVRPEVGLVFRRRQWIRRRHSTSGHCGRRDRRDRRDRTEPWLWSRVPLVMGRQLPFDSGG